MFSYFFIKINKYNIINFYVAELYISEIIEYNEYYSCCSLNKKNHNCSHVSRIIEILKNNKYLKKNTLITNEKINKEIIEKLKNKMYRLMKFKNDVIFDFEKKKIKCSCNKNLCEHIQFIINNYFCINDIEYNKKNIEKIYNLCENNYYINMKKNDNEIIFFIDNVKYNIYNFDNKIICSCLIDKNSLFYGLNKCDHIYYYNKFKKN
jgi:hypothetical protein